MIMVIIGCIRATISTAVRTLTLQLNDVMLLPDFVDKAGVAGCHRETSSVGGVILGFHLGISNQKVADG